MSCFDLAWTVGVYGLAVVGIFFLIGGLISAIFGD